MITAKRFSQRILATADLFAIASRQPITPELRTQARELFLFEIRADILDQVLEDFPPGMFDLDAAPIPVNPNPSDN